MAEKETLKEFEPVYTVSELVDAAKEFQTNRVVVRAALTKGGKNVYTMNEARKLIKAMKNKEVKA